MSIRGGGPLWPLQGPEAGHAGEHGRVDENLQKITQPSTRWPRSILPWPATPRRRRRNSGPKSNWLADHGQDGAGNQEPLQLDPGRGCRGAAVDQRQGGRAGEPANPSGQGFCRPRFGTEIDRGEDDRSEPAQDHGRAPAKAPEVKPVESKPADAPQAGRCAQACGNGEETVAENSIHERRIPNPDPHRYQRSLFAAGERVRRDAAGPAPRYGANRSAAAADSHHLFQLVLSVDRQRTGGAAGLGRHGAVFRRRGKRRQANSRLPTPALSRGRRRDRLVPRGRRRNHVPQSVARIPVRTRGAGRRFRRRTDRHLRRRDHHADYDTDRFAVLGPSSPRRHADADSPW